MRGRTLALALLAWTNAGWADFSYVQTVRQGMASSTMKQYFKGQKVRLENAGSVTILDLANKTVTLIQTSTRSYVTSKVNLPALLSPEGATATRSRAGVRETGQHRMIRGFEVRQVMVEMDVAGPSRGGPGTHVECEMWVARIPGYMELRRYQEKSSGLLAGGTRGGGMGLGESMAQLQRTLENLGGVPVQQVVRFKLPSSNAPMEIWTEMSDFSNAVLPASLFAAPAGYRDLGK